MIGGSRGQAVYPIGWRLSVRSVWCGCGGGVVVLVLVVRAGNSNSQTDVSRFHGSEWRATNRLVARSRNQRVAGRRCMRATRPQQSRHGVHKMQRGKNRCCCPEYGDDDRHYHRRRQRGVQYVVWEFLEDHRCATPSHECARSSCRSFCRNRACSARKRRCGGQAGRRLRGNRSPTMFPRFGEAQYVRNQARSQELGPRFLHLSNHHSPYATPAYWTR